MSKLEKLKFSEDHQWIRIEENEVVIGMTDFAQDELGDIVFVELPSVGADVKAGEPFGSVESVKTVSELYAPVSGKVIEINEQLESAPEKVNQSCYDDGWMVKVKLSDRSQLDNLWSYERYKEVYSEQ